MVVIFHQLLLTLDRLQYYNKIFDFNVNQIERDDDDGNLIAINLNIGQYTINVIALYGPNTGTLIFFSWLRKSYHWEF